MKTRSWPLPQQDMDFILSTVVSDRHLVLADKQSTDTGSRTEKAGFFIQIVPNSHFFAVNVYNVYEKTKGRREKGF